MASLSLMASIVSRSHAEGLDWRPLPPGMPPDCVDLVGTTLLIQKGESWR